MVTSVAPARIRPADRSLDVSADDVENQIDAAVVCERGPGHPETLCHPFLVPNCR
jgi:hypothetical protein